MSQQKSSHCGVSIAHLESQVLLCKSREALRTLSQLLCERLTNAFRRTEFRAPLQLLECDMFDGRPSICFLARLELPRHACQEIEIILRVQGLRCLLRSFELHQDDEDRHLFRQELVDQELVFDPHDLVEESSFSTEEIADGEDATLEAMCEHAVNLAALRRVYFDLPSYSELHARRARKANRRRH